MHDSSIKEKGQNSFNKIDHLTLPHPLRILKESNEMFHDSDDLNEIHL